MLNFSSENIFRKKFPQRKPKYKKGTYNDLWKVKQLSTLISKSRCSLKVYKSLNGNTLEAHVRSFTTKRPSVRIFLKTAIS